MLTSPDEPDPLLTTQASAGRATVKVEFPDDESMRISHEAIYQSLRRRRERLEARLREMEVLHRGGLVAPIVVITLETSNFPKAKNMKYKPRT